MREDEYDIHTHEAPEPLESAWINEAIEPAPKHSDIPSYERNTEVVTAEEKMSSGATLYKVCQDEVLRRLALDVDDKGRSLMWKVNAIKEDIANKRLDTSVMDWLAKETSKMMEKYF